MYVDVKGIWVEGDIVKVCEFGGEFWDVVLNVVFREMCNGGVLL